MTTTLGLSSRWDLWGICDTFPCSRMGKRDVWKHASQRGFNISLLSVLHSSPSIVTGDQWFHHHLFHPSSLPGEYVTDQWPHNTLQNNCPHSCYFCCRSEKYTMTGDMVVWRGMAWMKQVASRTQASSQHCIRTQRLVHSTATVMYGTSSARVSIQPQYLYISSCKRG